jgi:hypothetical protein
MVRSRTPASQVFLLVFLLWAAANALSYFVRSDGWGDLLGQSPQNAQAIGFPWLIWSEDGSYGSVNYFALLGNVATALLAAGMAYGIVAALTGHDAISASGSGPAASQPGRALQFQLRTLFALVLVEAVILGGIRMYGDARPALLAAIYLLGPSLLLAVAWRLRDVTPTHRNLALAIVGFLFVPAAAVLGESIDGIHDFTRGLLGLFVCWVPQCVLLATLIMALRCRPAFLRTPQRN